MQLGVALIGYGHWGPNLARALDGVDGAALQAVCVRRPAAAEAVARERPDVEATTDLDAVLARPDVDIVVVATPAPTHVELGGRALRAGKHVLVEKPLAPSLEAAEELAAVAAAERRLLMVGHEYVYHPVVRRLAELLRAGALGDLACITSERGNPTGTPADRGVLWNLAPHDLSIVVFLLGAGARRVSARAACDDVVFLTLELTCGVLVEVQCSWAAPQKTRRMTLTGSAGNAVFDELAADPLALYARRDGAAPERRDVAPPAAAEPLAAEWEELVAAVREGREPATGAAHALAVQRLLQAADASLAAGGAPVAPA
ncbi:MAG TPA: Gfo/Idh/MocA family oxidoreductase [Solirubrobacteraceae bacterium]|nr:Gfo/Idh/MocA family oxidoreductase [Solirubrobacteraceae bacterium]